MANAGSVPSSFKNSLLLTIPYTWNNVDFFPWFSIKSFDHLVLLMVDFLYGTNLLSSPESFLLLFTWF